jgi:hypothetical protein
MSYKRVYPSGALVTNLGRSRRDDDGVGSARRCRISSSRSSVRYTFGDFQTAYLPARRLSPVGAEGAGTLSPARIISKLVTPMPSCRAIGSGHLDCARGARFAKHFPMAVVKIVARNTGKP